MSLYAIKFHKGVWIRKLSLALNLSLLKMLKIYEHCQLECFSSTDQIQEYKLKKSILKSSENIYRKRFSYHTNFFFYLHISLFSFNSMAQHKKLTVISLVMIYMNNSIFRISIFFQLLTVYSLCSSNQQKAGNKALHV